MSQRPNKEPCRNARAVEARSCLDCYYRSRLMHEANPLGPGLSVTLTNRDGSFGELAYGVTDAGTGLDTPFPDRVDHKGHPRCHRAPPRGEKGLLDLDASVTQYLGWFQVPSKNYAPITVRHPIAHTSGPISIIDSVPASKYTAWMLRDTRTLFPPGERFHSSDVGYIVGVRLENAVRTGFPTADRPFRGSRGCPSSGSR